MKELFSSLILVGLLSACGKSPAPIPVLTAAGEVQQLPSEVYQSTLTRIVQKDLHLPKTEVSDEYDLEVITVGLSLEAGLGVPTIEASAYTQLELHFRESP